MASADELLSIETYAAVMAHLRHFRQLARDDVLRLLGVDERRYARSDAVYSARLSGEGDDDLECVRRFGVAFHGAIEDLRARRPDAPDRRLAEPDLDATAEAAAAVSARLPFGSERSAAFDQWLTTPGDPSSPRDDPFGSTLTAPLDASQRPATPFERAGGPCLPVEQYAALCASLATFSDRAHVLEQFGVPDADAHEELDRWYAAALASDPALKQRFREIVAQCRAALAASVDPARR